MKFTGIIYTVFALIVILAFAISTETQAQISVSDNWTASGKLALDGKDWSVIFSREDGALIIYSKRKEAIRLAPFFSEKANAIISCEVVQSNYEVALVKASFSNGQEQMQGSFLFDREGAIKIEPGHNMTGILISGEISYGVIPAPPLEDLIYDPKKYPSASHVYLPSENLFVGLLVGGNKLFSCAWPEGNQKVRIHLKDDEGNGRTIEAVEIQLDEKIAHLGILAVPGIWHREELHRKYLGKDIKLDWKKPFQAKWKTQLLEGDIETNFHFRTWQDRIWRPNFGFYEYPVWFDGEQAFIHTGKRVPPSGEAIIYALEGHEDVPIVFARRKLGDISALKQKEQLQRYPSDNVGIQNCDGRAWLKWIFKMNLQTRDKEFLREVMGDFIFSINVDAGRLQEYEAFIPELRDKISGWIQEEEKQEARLFLMQMQKQVIELEGEYWNKMHESPASEHLKEETEVINNLTALIDEEGLEIYPEIVNLLDRIQLWSDIEAVPGRVGGLLREMFQQAGYGCSNNESLIRYSELIRKDIRNFIIAGETHETIY